MRARPPRRLRYAARPLDRRIERIEFPREARLAARRRRRRSRCSWAPRWRDAPQPDRRRPRDVHPAASTWSYSDDLRTRLTSAVDNGRIDNWRIALDGFKAQPFHGTGAGTYRITWDHDRPAPPVKVNDGHSLYLETMSELGIVGLVLLLTALGTIAGRRRACASAGRSATRTARSSPRGRCSRSTPGIDWDWEMPALFVWLFGAGGVVLASRRPRLGELGPDPARGRRAGGARAGDDAGAVRLLAGPARSRRLGVRGDATATTAIDDALTATERFGTRPEPWMVLGYCDARLGQYALARRAMDAARSRDPNNWQYAYGQAIVYGVSGLDPRPYAHEALRLNPLDPDAVALVKNLDAAKTAAGRRDVTVRATIPSG